MTDGKKKTPTYIIISDDEDDDIQPPNPQLILQPLSSSTSIAVDNTTMIPPPIPLAPPAPSPPIGYDPDVRYVKTKRGNIPGLDEQQFRKQGIEEQKIANKHAQEFKRDQILMQYEIEQRRKDFTENLLGNIDILTTIPQFKRRKIQDEEDDLVNVRWVPPEPPVHSVLTRPPPAATAAAAVDDEDTSTTTHTPFDETNDFGHGHKKDKLAAIRSIKSTLSNRSFRPNPHSVFDVYEHPEQIGSENISHVSNGENTQIAITAWAGLLNRLAKTEFGEDQKSVGDKTVVIYYKACDLRDLLPEKYHKQSFGVICDAIRRRYKRIIMIVENNLLNFSPEVQAEFIEEYNISTRQIEKRDEKIRQGVDPKTLPKEKQLRMPEDTVIASHVYLIVFDFRENTYYVIDSVGFLKHDLNPIDFFKFSPVPPITDEYDMSRVFPDYNRYAYLDPEVRDYSNDNSKVKRNSIINDAIIQRLIGSMREVIVPNGYQNQSMYGGDCGLFTMWNALWVLFNPDRIPNPPSLPFNDVDVFRKFVVVSLVEGRIIIPKEIEHYLLLYGGKQISSKKGKK